MRVGKNIPYMRNKNLSSEGEKDQRFKKRNEKVRVNIMTREK